MKHWKRWVLLTYELLLLFFLLAELRIPYLSLPRATNQVILIMVLIFLPFLIPTTIAMIRNLKINISGQEFQVEFRDFHRDLQQINNDLNSRITTSEQVLFPIVGGEDIHSKDRYTKRHLIIGSKQFPEQHILAEIVARHLENSIPGLTCERRIPNGGTLKNYADLRYGWIDCYVEYTGTGCEIMNIGHRWSEGKNAGKTKDPDQLLADLNTISVPRHHVRWMPKLGPNNDYAIVMLADKVKALGITSISGLQVYAGRLTFTADIEFYNRRDGFPGLVNTYRDLVFKNREVCGIDQRYQLLREKKTDVIDGFLTDSSLHESQFIKLEDDQHFFPNYHCAPIVRTEALDEIDGLEKAFGMLANTMTNNMLIAMLTTYAQRNHDKAVPREQAENFLKDMVYANLK